MTVLHAVIERAENNYSAYIKEIDGLTGVGYSLTEVTEDLQKAINDFVDECKDAGDPIPDLLQGEFEISFSMDVKTFLEYYSGILTKSGLQKITGINQKQLGHYKSGLSVPRHAQRARIEEGLHRLGRELLSITL